MPGGAVGQASDEKGGAMHKIYLVTAAIALGLSSVPASAGPAEDATAAVTAWLDKFNAGDIDAFLAGHRDGAMIVDEFAPYSWGGSGSAKAWLDAYGADSEKRGITDPHMDYGAPIQANSDGSSAYIVLPTVYSFVQGGKKYAGKGSMTFVMSKVGAEWKISSWTYSGATPTAS